MKNKLKNIDNTDLLKVSFKTRLMHIKDSYNLKISVCILTAIGPFKFLNTGSIFTFFSYTCIASI